MSALIAALSGWRVSSQAPSPAWSVPPARPSARQAFEHRAPTPYPVDQSSIPAPIRRRLEHAQTTAESGATRWRLEPAALVRVEPDAVRLDAAAGLPLAGLRAVAVASDGAVWAGGSGGVVRFTGRPHPWERWQVFSGRRYLPSDDVVALAAGDAGAMWVRTGAGVSHLRLVALSLDDKAVQVEQRLRARHIRHGLVADSLLSTPGDLASSHQYPNDNDGLWTAIYAAAQSYRFAVTKSEEARDRATAALAALVRLEAITGIDGFPARSFRHRDEPRLTDGEWHWTADRPVGVEGRHELGRAGRPLLRVCDRARPAPRRAPQGRHPARGDADCRSPDPSPVLPGGSGRAAHAVGALGPGLLRDGRRPGRAGPARHRVAVAHAGRQPRHRRAALCRGVPDAGRSAPLPRADADVPVEPPRAELFRRGAGDALVLPALPLRARRDAARLLPPRNGSVVAEHPARGQPAVDLHLRAGQPHGRRAAGPRGAHARAHAAGPGDLVGAQRAPARRAARPGARPSRAASDPAPAAPGRTPRAEMERQPLRARWRTGRSRRRRRRGVPAAVLDGPYSGHDDCRLQIAD